MSYYVFCIISKEILSNVLIMFSRPPNGLSPACASRNIYMCLLQIGARFMNRENT